MGHHSELTRHFLALCISGHPAYRFIYPFSGPWCASVVGAQPHKPHDMSWHCAVQRHPVYGPPKKNPVPWCVEVWMVGAPPEPQTILPGIVLFLDTHPLDPKTHFLAHGLQRYGWLGRHPRTHPILPDIVWIKDIRPREPNRHFLAHGVQC